jgi:glutathione S-transferase
VFAITSHSLCPMMHAWRIALHNAGIAVHDIQVTVLTYAQRADWAKSIPSGAGLPFMRVGGHSGAVVLTGTLPVLQFIDETLQGAKLLPSDAAQRVHVRNRALVAIDVLNASRPVLTAQTHDTLQSALHALFAVLLNANTQQWSTLPTLDAVVLAAAATILCCQPVIFNDGRWSSLSALPPCKTSMDN